jgi:hypothetical protein
MPFVFDDFDPADYAADPDAYDPPPDAPRPTHAYVYVPPQAQAFDPGNDAYAALAFESLVAAGATHVRVRYDGGGDEGYAHVDAVRLGDAEGGERRGAAVIDLLTDDPETFARARRTRPAYGPAYLDGAAGRQLIDGLLGALAYQIASAVAGDGFGVGVSSVYGVATADLGTLAVTDHTDAAAPPGKD